MTEEGETDKKRGWVVVAAAFTVSFLADGFVFCFGILLVELINEFRQSRASTALVGSLMNSFAHLVAPVAGSIYDSKGARNVVITGSVLSSIGVFASFFAPNIPVLYVTFGIIGGAGMDLMYTPANSCVLKHFTKKKALATGIAICGSGVGTLVLSQLMEFCIDRYGWRGALLIFSALLLNGVPCGILLKEPENTKHRVDNYKEGVLSNEGTDISIDRSSVANKDAYNSIDGSCVINKDNSIDGTSVPVKDADNSIDGLSVNNDSTESSIDISPNTFVSRFKNTFDLSLLKDYRCICFLLSTLFVYLAYIIPYSLLPDQVVEENGMEDYEAAWLISSLGLSSTISRVLSGWLGDRSFINRFVLFETVIFLAGVCVALSLLLTTFETKLIFTCMCGLMTGGYATLLPVVLSDMFGIAIIGKSFGWNRFAMGIAGLISPPIGGWIFDQTGSYDITFLLAGGEFILGGAFLLLPKLLSRYCQIKAKDPG